MPKAIHFTAELMNAGGGGAYVLFPHSTEEIFGIKGRVPVRATIAGEPYRGSMVKYGNPQHMLPVLKGLREKTGKNIGDLIDITVELDTEKREIEIPKDLAKALKTNKLDEAFAAMSYSHQREYVQWVGSAKKAETRENRIAKIIERLQEKTK